MPSRVEETLACEGLARILDDRGGVVRTFAGRRRMLALVPPPASCCRRRRSGHHGLWRESQKRLLTIVEMLCVPCSPW